MADTAYHMEALRRQRVLERKAEASKRIEDAVGQTGNPAEVAKELRQSQLVFSEPGQYARNRNTLRVLNSLNPDHAQLVAKSKFLAKDVSRRHLADKELISRQTLDKFRVDSAGFNNRYRGRQLHNPHCDLAYAVVYPGKDNSDYNCDENRTNRRLNKNADKYDIRRKVNGGFSDSSENVLQEISG